MACFFFKRQSVQSDISVIKRIFLARLRLGFASGKRAGAAFGSIRRSGPKLGFRLEAVVELRLLISGQHSKLYSKMIMRSGSKPGMRFVVERQIRGSAVGCMLHVNACCRQASTMDFRELTPHTIQCKTRNATETGITKWNWCQIQERDYDLNWERH
ncbi:hypothetical protein EVAR_62427_1 [Eumeta japonica]|uniref:Uncharacterized protein n=1 Tax=Eumeta variegata TaxID=151549 RepID=A0A4C1Z8F5_EUMVA|nr:hypothetical protein EVAR_62427_1 [Eumeta japonica]